MKPHLAPVQRVDGIRLTRLRTFSGVARATKAIDELALPERVSAPFGGRVDAVFRPVLGCASLCRLQILIASPLEELMPRNPASRPGFCAN
jgi:hypothetical protein